MKKLDPSHPAYAKIKEAEKRHAERVQEVSKRPQDPKRKVDLTTKAKLTKE